MAKKIAFLILVLATSPIWIPGLALWWVFVRLVNFFGMQELRVKNGFLEMPMIYYEHNETEQMVMLVGMTHIAESDYFKNIIDYAKYCSERLGFKILYEYYSVKPEDVPKLNEKEMEVYQKILVYRRLHRKAADKTLLQYQFDTELGSKAPDSFINSDVDGLEFVKMMIERKAKFFGNIERWEKFVDWLPKETFRWLFNKAMEWFPALFALAKMVCWIIPSLKRGLKIVIGERNIAAMEKLSEQLDAGQHVVAIWGGAHLPGIGDMLEKKRFRRLFTEWLAAYRMRDYSFWEALCAFMKS